MRTTTLAILILFSATFAQYASDTVLFTVPLSKNASSLRACQSGSNPGESLSGPVLTAGGSFLLFGSRGYLLVDSSGTVLDSHQLAPGNTLKLAYPTDSVSVLLYGPTTQPTRQVNVYRKRFFEPSPSELSADQYRWLGAINYGTFVNILCNAITDPGTTRMNLAPQLVGYTALSGGNRWWALDRDMNFSSPLIGMTNNGSPFFPGLFECEGNGIPRDIVLEPRGTFVRDGRRCWMGVRAQTDTDLPRCVQRIVTCDDAGNVLTVDTVFKQENTDMMAGMNAVDGENVVTLIRGTPRLAFLPVNDSRGNIYYGVADYESCEFAVRRRVFLTYAPSAAQPLPQAFAYERDISWEPLSITPVSGQRTGAEIPRVSVTGPDGPRRGAAVRDLERSGFIARVARQSRRDIEAKLARGAPGMGPDGKRVLDSVAGLAAATAPWILSLSGPGGYIRTFAFGPSEALLCARVLGVRADSTVVIRADLNNAAEILLFTTSGAFVNRFTFNRQPWKDRKDFVVVRPDGALLELDFERDQKGMYLEWTSQMLP